MALLSPLFCMLTCFTTGSSYPSPFLVRSYYQMVFHCWVGLEIWTWRNQKCFPLSFDIICFAISIVSWWIKGLWRIICELPGLWQQLQRTACPGMYKHSHWFTLFYACGIHTYHNADMSISNRSVAKCEQWNCYDYFCHFIKSITNIMWILPLLLLSIAFLLNHTLIINLILNYSQFNVIINEMLR